MLLELAALKRLSPGLYKLKLGVLLLVGFLFLAFVGECAYMILHRLTQPAATQHTIPATAPRR